MKFPVFIVFPSVLLILFKYTIYCCPQIIQ
nr:MAG TPA: hypothetical protein [Caudoviricetes sp.]